MPSFSDHSGAAVFLLSLRMGVSLLDSGSVAGFALGVSLLAGWLANFSILIRWPAGARWAWIAIPWLSFALALWLLTDSARPLSQQLASLTGFYSWAAGIACIHLAHIAQTRRDQ